MKEPVPPHLKYSPKPPASLQELDIPDSLVEDLMLRRLYLQGRSTLSALCEVLKLSFPVISEMFQKLRQQQLLEVKGMVGDDYTFVLTGAGRALAAERYRISQYAGAAPVSLESYNTAVRAQKPQVQVNRESLSRALSDLVLTEGLLDQLGPALVSQRSLFLYGSTGNGKTCLAERVFRVFEDAIIVPYAVEVDGQIIVLFDPVLHERISFQTKDLDPRWVICRRPSVKVGGELDTNMLELQMDEVSKIYAAPVQMRANNGVLIIDDFGRQVMSPLYLLNRWIVPLDRRVDYLTLRYGVKFEIPFEMMVVFATNMEPRELADEAFFRRIQNKIHVEDTTPEVFDEIFHRIVTERNLPCEGGSAESLRQLCLDSGSGKLRACYPNDIVDIIVSIDSYEGQPNGIDHANLKRAIEIYFTKNGNKRKN